MNVGFRILLINISLRPESEKIYFPIGFAYIATAISNAGFEFEILDLDALRLSDEELEMQIKSSQYNVVAMGCIVTGYRYIKKVCELIKKHHNIPIIVGNSVATSIPHILMDKTQADIGVIGEGDITIIELINALRDKTPIEEVKGIFFRKNGEVIFTEERELIKSLDELPFINYDLFDMDIYLKRFKLSISEPYPIEFDKIKALPVNTARGCPFQCTFCYHVFRGRKYRYRSVENIVSELELLKEKYGVNYIQFADELSLFSKTQAEKLADYFIKKKLNIFWEADCRAGFFKENDIELAKKLKLAGCVSLGYSLESAEETILKAMDKHIKINDFEVQTKILQEVGIIPVTSIVIGYPQETPETLQKTFDCCLKCNIFPSAGYLLPQPGTPMYDLAIEMGLIKDEEEYLLRMGDRQDFTINFTKMSQEEIERITRKNLKKISEKLNLGLKKERLIKTGHYIQKDFRKSNT
ncbi:hypothetical protein LCGC14_0675980 [marine sediment metagenome]|uniref:Uncharacterized protein n=1 Tax=marine sediment metagenome TaxID=412755 RepID=A0A0F9R9S2_9ZZZZ